MTLRIRTKNHAAEQEIGFLTKSISKPYSRETAYPTWELRSHLWKKIVEIERIIFFNSALFLITISAPSKFSPEF